MNKNIMQYRYIVTTPKHVLCKKGFILKERFDQQTLRFFATFAQAKEYMENGNYSRYSKYNIVKVKLEVEVIDSESES
jgi:hypothetical protein